ncbi:MAG: ABC transporter permease [Alphaproteobacteria bacterium]|nr:ABC transporter permease [Alphaproteobacteria bacterium]
MNSITEYFNDKLQSINPQVLRILVLLVVLIAVLLFFSAVIPNYFNGRLFNRISGSVAIIGLIATAQTLVIITRNIDLSLGSIVGCVAYISGDLASQYQAIHPLLLVSFSVLLGGLFGAINGIIVAYARVPSIIVTLGTLAIYRSFLVEYSDAKSIVTAHLPHWLVNFMNIPLLQFGNLQFRAGFMLSFSVVIIVYILLNRLRVMRKLYAVGSNPEAAKMAGIDAKKVVLSAFVMAGALAGLAGFMYLARFGTITVVAGLGLELKSVAAAVVGGVNIFGGSGTVIGAFIGAILIDLIDTSLVRWQFVSEFWREAVLGGLILLSVTADTILMRRFILLQQLRGRKNKKHHE